MKPRLKKFMLPYCIMIGIAFGLLISREDNAKQLTEMILKTLDNIVAYGVEEDSEKVGESESTPQEENLTES